MKGPFCSVNVNTDEGFRKITKRRLAISIVLVIAGILILVINEYTRHAGISKVPEFYQGMFSGMGTGLIGAGIAQVVRFSKLLKDEAKLKAARISETDERLNAINDKALKVALAVMLIAMYVVLIAGIFVDMQVTTVMSGLLVLFLLAFIVANAIYSKKM